ncbi:YkgJ family cysteine cluster protein [Nitrincola lacisaponensis]|uniref:YkgJ family cysteine cluster protein n=1 Tax=Nitrincola lacisaponensis TaxID=267850 RepID=UPI00068BC4BD|nr:YkgJ family cysteine cluster protein [Nitrincola lacisaponensis]
MFGWLKKKNTREVVYRNKTDEFELPPIPKSLDQQFQALKVETNQYLDNQLKVLNAMYGYMNKYNKFISGFSVCKKGCSHCCKNDINITSLEAEYIAQNANVKPNSIPVKNENGKSICPFLSEYGECKVYEFRPFNCRTFHALDDPKYCMTDENHMIYGSSGHGYGSIILVKIYHAINQLNGSHRSGDIRSFFSKRS